MTTFIPTIIKETSNGYNTLPIESEMLNSRKIFCTGEINSESVNNLILQLMYLESVDSTSPIFLYINSGGGEVQSGLALYDVMQSLESPVHTVCMGMAASMAAILFAAGDKRLMLPHSKIMIHDPLVTSISGSALNVQKSSEMLMNTRNLTAEILAKHTGKTTEEILLKTCTDCYMTADEAISFGISDETITKLV